MQLGSRNKIDPTFNMSSMTDMVFLLLIFFILTSNFASPSGIEVSVPKSESSTKVIATINVTIDKDLNYYVETINTRLEYLEDALKDIIAKQDTENVVVVLHVDKEVPIQYVVTVGGLAVKYKAKLSIATQKE